MTESQYVTEHKVHQASLQVAIAGVRSIQPEYPALTRRSWYQYLVKKVKERRRKDSVFYAVLVACLQRILCSRNRICGD